MADILSSPIESKPRFIYTKREPEEVDAKARRIKEKMG